MRTLLCLCLLTWTFATTKAQTTTDNAPNDLPPPSSAAQKLYSAAKDDLLQIRVLVKNGRTQSSVGSGFFVGQSQLVITNYHVISQIALEPDRYLGEYVDTNDQRGAIELLAVDVLHDLAVLRVQRKGRGFFQIPDKVDQLPLLSQGQYLYSLGNPLDLGFAISEGAYNGVIGRSFYDQLMFTGPINSGMSGGPSVTASGALAGVNVAKRNDGELVSFLVPARFVLDLLRKVHAQSQAPTRFIEDIGQQLNAHQAVMVDQLLNKPLQTRQLGAYQVPVRESEQMRCWGSARNKATSQIDGNQISCSMETAIFVSHKLRTGHISLEHRYTQSEQLNQLRFSHLASKKFKDQINADRKQSQLGSIACKEDFVRNDSISLRAVICARAYSKFTGLYEFQIITHSLDQEKAVLQSNLAISGVSFENGMRIIRQFLQDLRVTPLQPSKVSMKEGQS